MYGCVAGGGDVAEAGVAVAAESGAAASIGGAQRVGERWGRH
jgi:hypothetical protein